MCEKLNRAEKSSSLIVICNKTRYMSLQFLPLLSVPCSSSFSALSPLPTCSLEFPDILRFLQYAITVRSFGLLILDPDRHYAIDCNSLAPHHQAVNSCGNEQWAWRYHDSLNSKCPDKCSIYIVGIDYKLLWYWTHVKERFFKRNEDVKGTRQLVFVMIKLIVSQLMPQHPFLVKETVFLSQAPKANSVCAISNPKNPEPIQFAGSVAHTTLCWSASHH